MNVTTFLVTATMENCALVLIMECANVENVSAIPNGTVQVRLITENQNCEIARSMNKHHPN